MMRSLDVMKAVGPDGDSSYTLKYCCVELFTQFVCCFIMCVNLGSFYCKGKCLMSLLFINAKILLLAHGFYRQIAVLPTLAMLFERVIYSQHYRQISPYISPTQFRFIKGTGAQDCGTALVFTAIHTLEHQMECRIVSLDICRAFDSVWCSGLLQHFWSVGMWSNTYSLMCSYLCDRTLLLRMVTPHPGDQSQQAFLRVAFGPLYCLICIYITFKIKFFIVICFHMLMIKLL